MKIKKYLFLIGALVLLFTGCSKDLEEYNKPAIYWYSKMIESISDGDLDRADDYYSSLQGEHIGSPLLPQATFIMALAHMYNEEYLLAQHYLDEYVRRFAANSSDKEEASFLKIKAKYLSLPNPRRDQALINEAIADAEKFKQEYPHSMHYYVVDTMLTRLVLSKAVLDDAIASLYERIDKPKAAAFYKEKVKRTWVDWSIVKRANIPWYREWFEGDGTSSWYDFLIPDTQSVVSRNTNKDTNTTTQRKQ